MSWWLMRSWKEGWFNNVDEKINSKYEGEIKNGVPNGKGTLIFPDGKKLEVEFKEGFFDKFGIIG